ncbi:MAG: MmgE/PrpD family protein [Pseudomonadota bacterium]
MSAAGAVGAALRRLTGTLSGLQWQALPLDVRHRSALVLADDLAAILAARDEPEVIALQDGLASASGPPEATVFNGRAMRLDRYSAALANGCAGDWAELDEGYRRVICHAGLYTLPALLAEAEAGPYTGEDLLRALVIGYETVARVARCFTFPNLVLHPHGSLAAVGAAAAVAALRRVDPDHAAGAISSAATMVCPGPYTHPIQGALVRNVWPGVAAQTGLRAVDWAGIGIRGLPSALHDVYVDAFGARADPSELQDGLGTDWAISEGYHKVYACCQYGHATIEASVKLRARGVAASDIAAISLQTHEKARLMDNPDPETTIAAKFSIQHIAATAAVHGGGAAEAFSAASLGLPDVARLRAAVSLAPFTPLPDWPNDRPTRVTWRLRDGTELVEEVLSARGGPDLPFSPAEIRGKIHGIVSPVYPAMAGGLDALLALEPDTLARPWSESVARMT